MQAGADRAELVCLREELRLDRELRNLREAVGGAREGAERVRDIVEDLRRLAADGSGEVVTLDLAECARIGAHWVLRGARQAADLQITGQMPLRVRGRPGHVQQVVMNLVQNAVDAAAGQPAPRVSLHLSTEGGMGCLSVQDNGPGISEAAAMIFDPFLTTKPVGHGTGLGLSISLKIAEEHGGHLLHLPAAQGALFRLELPLAEGAA